jgi:predicted pyridoxine 5'-phosphate oxidase superfamily flavin-nucleotide-binding protein
VDVVRGLVMVVMAIDPATRRRMRLNGRLGREPGGALLLHAEQVYANCPKYIVPRAEIRLPAATAGSIGRRGRLTEAQRAWIRAADTFFIATVHPDRGADASHRGGPRGFVQVEGNRLVWPDYAGNMMYNTLGNLAVHPRAGLLVPDFDRGALLQLTGRAAVDWDPAHAAAVPGAQRLVELVVEEVVELGRASAG